MAVGIYIGSSVSLCPASKREEPSTTVFLFHQGVMERMNLVIHDGLEHLQCASLHQLLQCVQPQLEELCTFVYTVVPAVNLI